MIHVAICIATIFGQAGDQHVGGKALALGRRVDPDNDYGIAHRTLPLGSIVTITNPRTGLAVRTEVIDRGPYGAIYRGNWVLKRNAIAKGKWRGCVDLTPLTAEAIGHNGYEPVKLTWR